MTKHDGSTGFESDGPPAQTLTPLQIQQKEFGVARFGGYRMRDVDEFLDQVTDALSAVLADNERLRRRASAGGGTGIVGTPDVDAVSRQADEIIQRARDEAARLIAEARAQATTQLPGSGTGGTAGDERAAVSAFLMREREFLQSLAALVQEHAEGVKGMARRSRAPTPSAEASPERPEAPAERSSSAAGETPAAVRQEVVPEPPAPPSPKEAMDPSTHDPASQPSPTGAGASPSPASRSAPPTPPAETGEAEPDEPTMAIPPAEPIVVEEPEPATARRGERDRPEPGRPDREHQRDPSLRELFWGEES
jgi:DivIVA domain-containing protein